MNRRTLASSRGTGGCAISIVAAKFDFDFGFVFGDTWLCVHAVRFAVAVRGESTCRRNGSTDDAKLRAIVNARKGTALIFNKGSSGSLISTEQAAATAGKAVYKKGAVKHSV